MSSVNKNPKQSGTTGGGGSSSGPPETVMTPEERVKALAEKAMLEVNPAVKAICYIRTGKEMIRTAESYQKDESDENAYLLYMRFLT